MVGRHSTKYNFNNRLKIKRAAIFSVLSEPSYQSQVPGEAVWARALRTSAIFFDGCIWFLICSLLCCKMFVLIDSLQRNLLTGLTTAESLAASPPEPSGIDFPLSFLGEGLRALSKGSAESLLSATADREAPTFSIFIATIQRNAGNGHCHAMLKSHYILQWLACKSWHSGSQGKITKCLSPA